MDGLLAWGMRDGESGERGSVLVLRLGRVMRWRNGDTDAGKRSRCKETRAVRNRDTLKAGILERPAQLRQFEGFEI